MFGVLSAFTFVMASSSDSLSSIFGAESLSEECNRLPSLFRPDLIPVHTDSDLVRAQKCESRLQRFRAFIGAAFSDDFISFFARLDRFIHDFTEIDSASDIRDTFTRAQLILGERRVFEPLLFAINNDDLEERLEKVVYTGSTSAAVVESICTEIQNQQISERWINVCESRGGREYLISAFENLSSGELYLLSQNQNQSIKALAKTSGEKLACTEIFRIESEIDPLSKYLCIRFQLGCSDFVAKSEELNSKFPDFSERMAALQRVYRMPGLWTGQEQNEESEIVGPVMERRKMQMDGNFSERALRTFARARREKWPLLERILSRINPEMDDLNFPLVKEELMLAKKKYIAVFMEYLREEGIDGSENVKRKLIAEDFQLTSALAMREKLESFLVAGEENDIMELLKDRQIVVPDEDAIREHVRGCTANLNELQNEKDDTEIPACMICMENFHQISLPAMAICRSNGNIAHCLCEECAVEWIGRAVATWHPNSESLPINATCPQCRKGIRGFQIHEQRFESLQGEGYFTVDSDLNEVD
jgi:hypothetical protein